MPANIVHKPDNGEYDESIAHYPTPSVPGFRVAFTLSGTLVNKAAMGTISIAATISGTLHT